MILVPVIVEVVKELYMFKTETLENFRYLTQFCQNIHQKVVKYHRTGDNVNSVGRMLTKKTSSKYLDTIH